MKKDLPIVPAIFPMPVVLIATYNEDGSIDVMNAAWCTAFDFKQIKLFISETHKTTENILRDKVFTVALADSHHIPEADYVGMVSAKKVKDKFAKTGLKASKGQMVNAPVLDDFPVIMECELEESIEQPYGVIGNIKRLAVDEKCLDENGKVDVSKLDIIAYDPFNHGYYSIGPKVGQAFSDFKKVK